MELTFEQFWRGHFCVDPDSHEDKILWLHEACMDIGGGKISIPEIDVLAEHPEVEAVAISGLRQDTFDYFIRTYGQRLRAIEFFKNKLVEDWSLLGTLPKLEYVYWFANQRIDRLWDMSGNTALKGLGVSDFTRLHSIEGIQTAPALRYFCFKDAVWDTSEVESFSPLAHTGVTHLMFGAKRDGTVYKNGPNNECLELPGAYIVGKRKPALAYEKDAARIQKYVDQFEVLKEKYRGVPYKEIFG